VVEHSERLWARRLRWRLRGAWMWPAYAVLTLLDAVILHELPPVSGGVDFIPALIVSSFCNLFLMGVVAPWLGRRLAKREPAGAGNGVPLAVRTEVLKDRTAAVLLGLATLGLIAAGLAAQPLIVAETKETERNAELVRDHVLREAPAEVQRNLDTANTIKLEDGYFRTCVNYDDRTRAYCLFVDVDAEPPLVTEDPSTLPNQEFRAR
jgi:hypothetical protein